MVVVEYLSRTLGLMILIELLSFMLRSFGRGPRPSLVRWLVSEVVDRPMRTGVVLGMVLPFLGGGWATLMWGELSRGGYGFFTAFGRPVDIIVNLTCFMTLAVLIRWRFGKGHAEFEERTCRRRYGSTVSVICLSIQAFNTFYILVASLHGPGPGKSTAPLMLLFYPIWALMTIPFAYLAGWLVAPLIRSKGED